MKRTRGVRFRRWSLCLINLCALSILICIALACVSEQLLDLQASAQSEKSLRYASKRGLDPCGLIIKQVEPGIKVIHCMYCETSDILEPVETSTGKKCVVLRQNKCKVESLTHGVIWNGAELTSLDAPSRTHLNSHQVWFVRATEVHAPPYRKRPIGDVRWLASMNYASHYGSNTDFPVDAIPGLKTWPIANKDLFRHKTHSILYMSSNCQTQSERDDFLRRASNFLDIDSVGSCMHNKDFPWRLKHFEEDSEGKSMRLSWQNYGPGMRAILEIYRFRLVIINTLCVDYWADGDKIYQSLEARTIPIYLGMPNSHDWDPGIAAGVHPAMIHIQDFAGLQELAEFLHDLGADTEEALVRRRRYFEYQGKPPTLYPRHAEHLRNKTGGMDWMQYVCEQTHHGNSTRRVEPQQPCGGSWWKYLESIGKNLSLWGCSSSDPCI